MCEKRVGDRTIDPRAAFLARQLRNIAHDLRTVEHRCAHFADLRFWSQKSIRVQSPYL